jgi:hypothetical protein
MLSILADLGSECSVSRLVMRTVLWHLMRLWYYGGDAEEEEGEGRRKKGDGKEEEKGI